MADKRDERTAMLRQSGASDGSKAISDLVFALFRALMSRRLSEPSRRRIFPSARRNQVPTHPWLQQR